MPPLNRRNSGSSIKLASKCNKRPRNGILGLDDLKTAVGSHFFVWSFLERQLAQSLGCLERQNTTQAVYGISRVLERWKKLHGEVAGENTSNADFVEELFVTMSEGLEIRNRIAHGITGFNAEGGTASNVFIQTALNGKSREISYEDLTLTNERLNYIASHMDRVTRAVLHLDSTASENIRSEISSFLHP